MTTNKMNKGKITYSFLGYNLLKEQETVGLISFVSQDKKQIVITDEEYNVIILNKINYDDDERAIIVPFKLKHKDKVRCGIEFDGLFYEQTHKTKTTKCFNRGEGLIITDNKYNILYEIEASGTDDVYLEVKTKKEEKNNEN